MIRIKIPYLVALRGRGGIARYFWQPSTELRAVGWPSVRLARDVPPEHAEAAAVAEAMEINQKLDEWRRGAEVVPAEVAPPIAAGGTIGAMIDAYRRDEDFLRLARNTRKSYEQNLLAIGEWGRDTLVIAVTPKAAKKLYKSIRGKTPSKAAAVVRMGRILWQWGIGEDLAGSNPFRAVKIKNPRRVETLDQIWSDDAVASFVAAADRLGRHSLGTAIMLNSWFGQREADIIEMPRAMYRDGVISYNQAKTGALVHLPVGLVAAIAARLEAEFARQAARKVTDTTLIVSETTGRRYGEDNFRHVFAAIRTEVAKEKPEYAHLQFMHLRHTAVVRLEEAATPLAEVAAITGHSRHTVGRILDRHYGRRTAKLARKAITRRLEDEGE